MVLVEILIQGFLKSLELKAWSSACCMVSLDTSSFFLPGNFIPVESGDFTYLCRISSIWCLAGAVALPACHGQGPPGHPSPIAVWAPCVCPPRQPVLHPKPARSLCYKAAHFRQTHRAQKSCCWITAWTQLSWWKSGGMLLWGVWFTRGKEEHQPWALSHSRATES